MTERERENARKAIKTFLLAEDGACVPSEDGLAVLWEKAMAAMSKLGVEAVRREAVAKAEYARSLRKWPAIMSTIASPCPMARDFILPVPDFPNIGRGLPREDTL